MLKGTKIEVSYYEWIEKRIIPVFKRLSLKPDQVTFLALFSSILAGGLFSVSLIWGGIITLLSGLFDTLDGSLARTLQKAGPRGAFLDSVLDRYADFFLVFGIWLHFQIHSRTIGNFLITSFLILFLFGSLMVSYTRARAEALGYTCHVGLFQRAERIILVGIGGIISGVIAYIFPAQTPWLGQRILTAIIFLLAIGTNITAIQRTIFILRSKHPENK